MTTQGNWRIGKDLCEYLVVLIFIVERIHNYINNPTSKLKFTSTLLALVDPFY